MLDKNLMEKVLLALVPAVFAFIPALLNWLSTRASSTGRAARVTSLAAELKFLEQWLALARGASTEAPADAAAAGKSVQRELELILHDYSAMRDSASLRHPPPGEVPAWRRALLLFKPLSSSGWLLHTSFYFIAIFAVALVVSEAVRPDPATGSVTDLMLGLAVLFGPVLIGLAWTAGRQRSRLSQALATQHNQRANILQKDR